MSGLSRFTIYFEKCSISLFTQARERETFRNMAKKKENLRFIFSLSSCITERNKSSKCKRNSISAAKLLSLTQSIVCRFYIEYPKKHYFYMLLCSADSVMIVVPKVCHHIHPYLRKGRGNILKCVSK